MESRERSSVFDLSDLVAELNEPADEEHADVSISDESGWTLSAFQSGLIVWENAEEDDEPRHLPDVSRDETRRLMELVAAGDLDQIEALDWRPGYR